MPKVTDEHRLARRQQIVRAARACVTEQGFHKTTMADVIRASGLSAGAVYGYFKSKEELIAAIADDGLSTVDQLFDGILAEPGPLSLTETMRKILEYVVGIADAPNEDVTRVALQAWAEALHNPTIAATAREKYTMLRNHYVDVVRRAQTDGTLDPDADPEYVAQALFSLLPGFILQRLLLGDVTPDSYLAGLAALLPGPASRTAGK
ncbi:TetR family transcriptional regulator [Kribbella amoyensis]|uniref:TetR family transcriptional regulator n=1 Tax=Kribbella amoyensis TaxID=996641 RepID=A0A561B7Z5_9ACTN|nr:TetR/AcrR family transcriptional regulator [Kribbella amoyensis]TWD74897.1 TetR family transcriptional regulator [Kribbella amoyensis]